MLILRNRDNFKAGKINEMIFQGTSGAEITSTVVVPEESLSSNISSVLGEGNKAVVALKKDEM